MLTLRNAVPILATLFLATLLSSAAVTVAPESPVATPNPNVVNCTWIYVDQPLDHFARGANHEETFKLRVCVNDKFLRQADGPVFFCK
jgi:hypothetical protein